MKCTYLSEMETQLAQFTLQVSTYKEEKKKKMRRDNSDESVVNDEKDSNFICIGYYCHPEPLSVSRKGS